MLTSRLGKCECKCESNHPTIPQWLQLAPSIHCSASGCCATKGLTQHLKKTMCWEGHHPKLMQSLIMSNFHERFTKTLANSILSIPPITCKIRAQGFHKFYRSIVYNEQTCQYGTLPSKRAYPNLIYIYIYSFFITMPLASSPPQLGFKGWSTASLTVAAELPTVILPLLSQSNLLKAAWRKTSNHQIS